MNLGADIAELQRLTRCIRITHRLFIIKDVHTRNTWICWRRLAMTEQRTATEIRLYLEPRADNDMPLHDYIAMLEEDLLRVLDACGPNKIGGKHQ